MKKYQVLSRDGYGTTVILETANSLEKALDRIRAEVTNANFENALTTDDKYRTIEAYFPIVTDDSGEDATDLVYAGNNTDGRHRVYKVSDSGIELGHLDPKVPVRIFIGVEGGEDRYLEDTRGEFVHSLFEGKSDKQMNSALESKTYYFIKVIG